MERQSLLNAETSQADDRPWPMKTRGTPATAPLVRRMLDEVAVRVPSDDFGYALYLWAEEVTRLLEARAE